MSLTIQRPAIPVPLPLTRGGTEATTAAGARTTLGLGDLALLTAPGGTSTFLRADKTWAVPPGGGGGSTTLLGLTDVPDTYVGQASKVLAVRSDETGTEFVTPAAGGGGAPTDAEYVTSTAHASLSAERVLTDTATITWDRATAGQIKANAIGGGGYTDEQAQDAVGAMLLATATIDLTYADATPSLSASVKDASITEAKLSLSDVTTKDASTTAHGLLRKLSGTATQYLDGSGAWTTPAGGGANYWSRVAASNTLLTAFTALWSLEEATGTRVDRIGALAMTPVGGANLTQVAGRVGQAVGMNGTAGTYLSVASTAAVAMSPTTSLTVMAWVYLTALNGCGYVSKGTSGTSATYEYLLSMNAAASKFQFGIANGATFQILQDTGAIPTLNAWHLVLGWFDVAANTLNLQVDNGSVVSVAATTTSYTSVHPCEIGRHAGWGASPSLNGRLDMAGIAKRVLTATERAALWNAGAGLDYPFGVVSTSYVTPLTPTDSVLLGATRLTEERLEVDGAVKLGTTTGTTDGTLRWTGTDFEGRKGGAWASMTGAASQPLDATLTALAGLATGADQLPYATGTDTFAQTPFTPFARTLLDDTTQAAMRTTLGLTPGTDVQAQDAELQAIAGLTSAADRLPYFTGAGTAALATFTAAGRTLAGAADAAAQRTALALGTMAQQDAANVAITGGSAQLSAVGLGTAPTPHPLWIVYDHTAQYGFVLRQTVDTGGAAALLLLNAAQAQVGSITTTATATSYNTSSDARLKHAIEMFQDALALVRQLRPVKFKWNSTEELDHGFLAHELQQIVPGAVTGQPDEVNPDGSVKPQQVDNSKLVVFLVGAVQELLKRVEALEELVTAS